MQLASEIKLHNAADLFRKKSYKKSFLELVQISTELSKDLRYLHLMAEVQKQLRDQVGRLATLKAIVQVTQNPADSLIQIQALIQAGRLNEALDVCIALECIELTAGQKVEKNKLLLSIYSQENDFEGLLQACEELNVEGYQGSDYFYARGLLAIQSGDEDAAILHLRTSVQISPNYDQGWAALGLLHDKRGDRELAKANVEKALDVNPYNAVALKCLTKWSGDGAELKKASIRVNHYLQRHNFDEDMTAHHVELLVKNGQSDFAQSEVVKLSYYFGKALAL